VDIQVLEDTISNSFPECLDSVKVALAVCAITRFSDNHLPTTLIFCGASGSGKTLPISFMFPDQDHMTLNNYIYRSDKFTPRSFVSHAANITKDELREIDLLPKIKDKVFLTKELAPVFRGKQDELTDTFSILISVLDGRGYISDSGARGRRGYQENINFCWIGATTPLTNQAHELMAQLGTRLLFYTTDRKHKTIDELMAFAKQDDHNKREVECRRVVNDFLVALFTKYKPNSTGSSEINFTDNLLRKLVVAVKVMAIMRSSLNNDMSLRKENEERAIIVLKNIVRGSALIHGRDFVDDYDIRQIQHICLSTMPRSREMVLRALLNYGGCCTTTDVVNITGMSAPYARKIMELMSRLGICTYQKGSHVDAAEITLKEEFNDLIKSVETK